MELHKFDIARQAAASLFARTHHVVVLFSGGKDSVVLVHLLEPWRERVSLVWANTGDGPPGKAEFVRGYGTRFRLFEIATDPRASWEAFGPPAEVVAVSSTRGGKSLDPVQPWTLCCWRNRNVPAMAKAGEIAGALSDAGLTVALLDGQRNADMAFTQDEARAVLPSLERQWLLWDWSDADVWEYVASERLALPPHYSELSSSCECLSCPADLSMDRLAYLDRHQPHLGMSVRAEALAALSRAESEGVRVRAMIGEGRDF
jgi:3'-phosphoadenosine 5'-phosphosulfate sulfotransferase (PAPS reductase)/FAD synthetase